MSRLQKSRILAELLIENRPIKTSITGIRPGEKVHEILISEEEAHRTIARGDYYVIQPILPEICSPQDPPEKNVPVLKCEFSSNDNVMSRSALLKTLHKFDLMLPDHGEPSGELLR